MKNLGPIRSKVLFPSRLEALLLSIIPQMILRVIFQRMRAFDFIRNTAKTQVPISFRSWHKQKIEWHCADAYWPVHPTSVVFNPANVYCGIETSPGYMQGNYIQAFGKVYVGDYTQIGPNVGIISANHDLYDTSVCRPGVVRIGRYCWLGMGSIILPGVELGDFTMVAAGAVVTKSFPDGHCVVAGNPAKLVKPLEKSKCVGYRSQHEYNGYIPTAEFDEFRKNHLNV